MMTEVGMRTLGQPPGVGGVTTAEQTRANPGRKKTGEQTRRRNVAGSPGRFRE
jgi:hypothetical protein